MSNHGKGTEATVNRHRPARAAIVIAMAAFAVLALISALQLYVARAIQKESGTLAAALVFGVASWIGWMVLSPAIIWLWRSFDFRRGRRTTSVIVHVIGALVCNVPTAVLLTVAGVSLYGQADERITRKMLVQAAISTTHLQLSLLVYTAILGLTYAITLWDRLQTQQVQAARLESQAANARLEALGMRLQPHFLFNTLHTIGALIDENPRQARTMLVHLGDLLRDVLAESSEVEVPLREELDLLRRYLAIEQIRFADRLHIAVDAAADTLNLMVPRLLLQPLVENAARHGIAASAAGGRIDVSARREANLLVIRVWNDGAPLRADHGERTGLTTTRARLTTRHGSAASLALRMVDGGVESRIELPAVTRG